MKTPKRYTVTAALPYANGPLHIGHLAGVYVPADIFVRYLRLSGKEVLFVCGSDEHGAAITLRAKKEGISPQEIIDKYHGINKKAFEDFGIDFNIFHRTSDPLHHKTAQDFFKVLLEKGAFEVQTSSQYFDEQEQQFLADRYIIGTCPNCGFEHAYGDQCERCGTSLSPSELINPRSAISGSTPVLKETQHWYLPMQNHEEWVREWLLDGMLDGKKVHDPANWKRQVLGQCKSWLDAGLHPRAMTRDLDWGVPVPVQGADGKVLYVWLDAPIGYISATKAWAQEHNDNWEKWWKDDDSSLIHFLAKDNIVFHCIIFPILLREHGEFILPNNVPANEFLNLEGQKLSTSRNWAVWLHEYLEEFPNRQDELRYVLSAIAPEFRDSEFTWSDYQARVNNELVAVLGNFVNRTLVLTHKYFKGRVPARHNEGDVEKDLLSQMKAIPESVGSFIMEYRLRDAQQEAMSLARLGNKYLTETEPWKTFKTDQEKTGTILNVCLQLCANITTVLAPFLPHTCETLRQMLKIETLKWSETGGDILESGHEIGPVSLLFSKVEDEMVTRQTDKLEQAAKDNLDQKEVVVKPEITFEEFQKLDMRIGKILEAEKVPKTSKLLKLKVKVGKDDRTIVSGIAAHYSPEECIGKKVTVLLNLAPRKIKGILSEGMILMAEDAGGKLSFLSPEKDFAAGSSIS